MEYFNECSVGTATFKLLLPSFLMPWVNTSTIAKALGTSPEKAGWLMRRLSLKRRRVKGRSQWFIEPELLPDELKQKLLPDVSQSTATSESRSNSATHGVKETATIKAENPPKKLLRAVYDYLKHNHPVIEREGLRDMLQGILKRLLDELMSKGYKPIEIEKAVVRIIKSYRDLGFMDLLGIGNEP